MKYTGALLVVPLVALASNVAAASDEPGQGQLVTDLVPTVEEVGGQVDGVMGAIEAFCDEELEVDCPALCSTYANPVLCITKHYCISLSGPLVWTAGPDTTRGLVGAGVGVPAFPGWAGGGSGLGFYAGVQLVGTSGIDCPK